jgi:hydrogenase maturation protease
MHPRTMTEKRSRAPSKSAPPGPPGPGQAPAGACPARTVVVGLGNSIRGDDAAGLMALERLARSKAWPGVRFVESEESNINLLEVLAGAEALLLLDTISTAGGQAGTVHRLDLEDLRGPGEAYATHQLGVARVLDLGRTLGLPMPVSAVVLALEIAPSDDFGVGLSPDGRAGLERLVTEAAGVLDHCVQPTATAPCAAFITP